jgi:hypothetical protein
MITTHKFAAEIAADRGQISMHARPHFRSKPRLASLGAKDDVKNDLAERLGHGANDY